MKTVNKLKYKVIMYLLLSLCALFISFHLTIYGVQFVQEAEDSHLASINNEYQHTGDGNNNSQNHKIISNKLNRITSNNPIELLFYTTGTFSIIILFILICESYFKKQDYLAKIYKKSLIAQKIRLNN